MLVLLFAFLCPPQLQAAPLKVMLVLSEGSGAYQEFSAELQRNQSTQFTLQVSFVGDPVQDADLLIAVGMKAATALSYSDKPVLNALVPSAGYTKLQRSTSQNFSAVFIDQPIERQIALISKTLPAAKSLGVLHSSFFDAASLRQVSAKRGLSLQTRVVSETHPLASALGELLAQIDVLLVIPDPAIYNSDTIRNILLATYREKVPLVGLSSSYVRAGALCAVYSTPQQIARQTASVIEQFSVTGKLPPVQYANDFEVAVNTRVARSLNLTIEDEEQLRRELMGEQ